MAHFIAYDVLVHNPPRNLVAHSLAVLFLKKKTVLGTSLSQGTNPVLDSIPFCIRSPVVKDLALVYKGVLRLLHFMFFNQMKSAPRTPFGNK